MPLSSRLDPRQAIGKNHLGTLHHRSVDLGEERSVHRAPGRLQQRPSAIPHYAGRAAYGRQPFPTHKAAKEVRSRCRGSKRNTAGTVLIARRLSWSVPRRGADCLRPVVDDRAWFGVAARHLGSTLVLRRQRFGK